MSNDSKQDHKAKMAVMPQTPPGQEQDGKGHVIPFSQRTKDDQEKTLAGNLAGNKALDTRP